MVTQLLFGGYGPFLANGRRVYDQDRWILVGDDFCVMSYTVLPFLRDSHRLLRNLLLNSQIVTPITDIQYYPIPAVIFFFLLFFFFFFFFFFLCCCNGINPNVWASLRKLLSTFYGNGRSRYLESIWFFDAAFNQAISRCFRIDAPRWKSGKKRCSQCRRFFVIVGGLSDSFTFCRIVWRSGRLFEGFFEILEDFFFLFYLFFSNSFLFF